jgi:hypothetical protein
VDLAEGQRPNSVCEDIAALSAWVWPFFATTNLLDSDFGRLQVAGAPAAATVTARTRGGQGTGCLRLSAQSAGVGPLAGTGPPAVCAGPGARDAAPGPGTVTPVPAQPGRGVITVTFTTPAR